MVHDPRMSICNTPRLVVPQDENKLPPTAIHPAHSRRPSMDASTFKRMSLDMNHARRPSMDYRQYPMEVMRDINMSQCRRPSNEEKAAKMKRLSEDISIDQGRMTCELKRHSIAWV